MAISDTQSGQATAEPRDLAQRMDSMYARDRVWGIGFVIALWIVYLFTFFTISPIVGSGATTALLIGGALVLLYNTGSITAMLKQYLDHKRRVYEPDIRHLDEKRARKGQRV